MKYVESKKIVFSVSLLVSLGLSTTVFAGSTQCVGSLPPGEYDNVVVPAGSDCQLRPGVVINGNFEANGANFIDLGGVSVGGNVDILNSTGFTRFRAFIPSVIHGNFTLENTYVDNQVPPFNNAIQLASYEIKGNVTISNNRTTSGTFFTRMIATNNIIHGNLTMSNNSIPNDSGEYTAISATCNMVGGNATMNDNQALSITHYAGPEICEDDNIGVGGNITMNNNTGGEGEYDVFGSPAFGGVFLSSSQAKGNITFRGNQATGVITVSTSHAAGNFTCANNDPAPIQDNLDFDGASGPNSAGRKLKCNN